MNFTIITASHVLAGPMPVFPSRNAAWGQGCTMNRLHDVKDATYREEFTKKDGQNTREE